MDCHARSSLSSFPFSKVPHNSQQALRSSVFLNNQINTENNDVKRITENNSDGRDKRWPRIKRNIPVLEPVRHLLNGIREGTINHTTSVLFPNHLVGNKSVHGNNLLTKMQTNTTSAAIETEEEREMVTHGYDLRILEFLAAAGNKLWTFFSGLRDAVLTGVVNASSGSSAFG